MVDVLRSQLLHSDSQSPELFADALKTIPFAPFSGSILFNMRGVPFTEWVEKDKHDQYLQDCSDKGVIPFSEITFKYSPEIRGFVFHKYWLMHGMGGPISEQMDEGLISGKKADRIHVLIGSEFSFNALRQSFMAQCLEPNGYQPILGALAIATRDVGVTWSGGDRAYQRRGYNAGLLFGTEDSGQRNHNLSSPLRVSTPGLSVNTRGNVAGVYDEQLDTLNSWFNKLTQASEV